MVVAGAILTGTLVVGRNYGPTYYAQYGGNLQQAGMIIKFNVFIQCEKNNIYYHIIWFRRIKLSIFFTEQMLNERERKITSYTTTTKIEIITIGKRCVITNSIIYLYLIVYGY